jgi:integrase
MHRSEFLNQVSVKFWLDSLNGGEPVKVHTTQYNWIGCLERYCEWIGKTPDKLIAERREASKSDDERLKHQVEIDIKRFLRYLEEQKHLAPSTCRSYFIGIRNFYKRNYLDLQFFRGDGPRQSSTVQKGARAANKDDIRKMLEVSDPRVKALILFIKDTGLSESDVVKLKLRDLGIKDMDNVFSLEPPIPLVLTRKKTGRRIITFIGQEAYEALKVTLQIRQIGTPEMRFLKYGNEVKKKGVDPEKLTLDSPLFRSYHKELTGKAEIKHLTPHAVSSLIRIAAKVAGVWQTGFSAHGLRRFFQTSLEMSGIQSNWVKRMMGHALGGSEEPYSKPEIETLRMAYERSYPYLAITEKVEQQSRVEALENQVEALIMNGKRKEQEIMELRRVKEEKETRIDKTEQRLEQLEKMIRKLMEQI